MDPPVASGSALVATTAEVLWTGALYTPVFANDPKAGKIYSVRAGGILSTSASASTLILAPLYNAVALGASVTQTVPPSLTNVPWYLQFDLVFRVINGSTSTCIGTGLFVCGATAATAGSGFALSMGGTSGTVDITANTSITVNKTLSVAGSVTTQFAYIFSRN